MKKEEGKYYTNLSDQKENSLQIQQHSLSYDQQKVKENKHQIIFLLFLIMFLSGIIRYYFITFFPLYWKESRPTGGEGMSIWMINCIEFSVLIMFPLQEYLLKYIGQKNYMIMGLVILIITNFGITLIDIIKPINEAMQVGLTSRFLQGTGICMTQTAIFSLTCLIFESNKLEYMGYINSAMGIGEVGAPFIGSMLFGSLGYINQFLFINFIVFIFILLVRFVIPSKQDCEEQEVSLSGAQIEQGFYKNIFTSKRIIFDIVALCFINIWDCVHVGFFPTVLNEKYNLSQEVVGLVYGIRGLSFIVTCLAIPRLKIAPKLQHLIGILLESISLGFLGCSQFLGFTPNISVVCIGFILQGIGSPCIMVSSMSSMLDTYLYENDLNPILHNKTYSHLCDTFSNICECIFALFFLVGSFSGEMFYEHFQEQTTFNIYMMFGLIAALFFFIFDCGLTPYRDNQKIQQKIKQYRYLETKQD